jgi:hypothetical protein
MAILFPLKLNDVKLFVNPTMISVKKRADIARVKTMAGTTFQVWPDLPDEIRFEGILYGLRSLFELRNLQDVLTKAPEQKEVTLTYKLKKYQGYILDFEISAEADKPRQFRYNFNFISKTPFNLPNMTLGQLTGLATEFDFIQAQLRGVVNPALNLPADIATDLQNVGQQLGRVGLNIGRPKIPFS